MPFRVANLLKQLPDAAGAEVVESIVRTPGVLIERIVSQGQATPEGEWYDQERAEWVMLVSGSAGLLFDGEQKPHRLEPGDHLLIPAHCRHRVAWTDPEKTTVWLAVHVGDER
jgi:cupin 2 domain-containing protein